MDEIWKSLDMTPDYEVSSLGRVRRVTGGMGARAGRILKTHQDTFGYESLHVTVNKRPIRTRVHVLVCTAFYGSRPTDKHVVAHSDGNTLNNNVANLRWATQKENCADAMGHGTLKRSRGQDNPHSILTDDAVRIIRSYPKPAAYGLNGALAKRFGVSPRTIEGIRCKTEKLWPHIPLAK